ncbi:dCTP deaminase [Marinobacterium litorale]|uniref:dCTP deaminase n=1 Tax=Marinobacterium litorale TaxID=404770 RepID=UPI00146FBF9D|nr:hypothetical protein [Marinobacterium litorale]
MIDKNEFFDVGTISDTEIKRLCSSNRLIVENYDERNIKQCCYELTASNIYYELSDVKSPPRSLVENNGYILIKPKQNIVVITKEVINLDRDMLGRILSKGKLFSIGLLPVNTYADPGFHGNLGIVFYNSSHDYIKIFPGERIAKIEFSKLKTPVDNTYHGQHGYQTEIWPIPTNMLLTEDEIRKDSRIRNKAQEIEVSYGKDMAAIYRKLFVYFRSTIVAACLFFIAMILLISSLAQGDKVDTGITILFGVASNIIVSLATFLITAIGNRKK